VLPGLYVLGGGELTAAQREIAAVLYAGSGCAVTGHAALRRRGVRVPHSDLVDVLIPASVKRQSVSFVQLHRTYSMPDGVREIGGVPYAPAARAVADAVRGRADRRSVTALVADAVQHGACTVTELAAELRSGPRQGSTALRAALAEVADGIASVAEGDLRKLIKKGNLPEPMYNPRLFIGTRFLAQPDAWWPGAGVAAEVDSREWHLSPDGWERTLARHAKMTAHGILVLHFPPRRIRSEPMAVIEDIRKALAAGRGRGPQQIRAVRAR
jgi:hypothetical protein